MKNIIRQWRVFFQNFRAINRCEDEHNPDCYRDYLLEEIISVFWIKGVILDMLSDCNNSKHESLYKEWTYKLKLFNWFGVVTLWLPIMIVVLTWIVPLFVITTIALFTGYFVWTVLVTLWYILKPVFANSDNV